MMTVTLAVLIAVAVLSLVAWYFVHKATSVSDETFVEHVERKVKEAITRFVTRTRSQKRSAKRNRRFCYRLTPSQRRRQARLRRRAIKQSALFIRKMREEKGLMPVVVTARQRKEKTTVEHTTGRLKGSSGVVIGWGKDQVLWRELKASA